MKKLLKKLSLFLILILITNNVFASEKDVIKELKERLESSNQTIERLIENIKEKSDINKDLIEQVKEKEDKIKTLENEVKVLTNRLKINNEIINKLTERVEKDQDEINELRASLDDTSNYVDESNTFILGFNPTYPLGGQTVFGVKLNALPIGIYSSFSIQENYYISGGIGIMFEF
jgi:septal ring factor EnvC (AmiA/AmiB activator)